MSLKNCLKTLLWKIVILDPAEIETEVLTDNVGDRHMCMKMREGRKYYVLVLEGSDAEHLVRTMVQEAMDNDWDLFHE